jgi:hypothetical protein
MRPKGAWYVSFEYKDRPVAQRPQPRVTKAFRNERDAKAFARTKLAEGLNVIAGTLNPHLPKRTIGIAPSHPSATERSGNAIHLTLSTTSNRPRYLRRGCLGAAARVNNAFLRATRSGLLKTNAATPRASNHSPPIDESLSKTSCRVCGSRVFDCHNRRMLHPRNMDPDISAVAALDPCSPTQGLTLKCLDKILFIVHDSHSTAAGLAAAIDNRRCVFLFSLLSVK